MTLIHFLLLTDPSAFRAEVISQVGSPGSASILDKMLDILTTETPIPKEWEISIHGNMISSNGLCAKSGHHDYLWMSESIPGWIWF